MLIGILPIYVAVALGMLIFAAPVEAQRMVLSLGLVLPFLAGLGASTRDGLSHSSLEAAEAKS